MSFARPAGKLKHTPHCRLKASMRVAIEAASLARVLPAFRLATFPPRALLYRRPSEPQMLDRFMALS